MLVNAEALSGTFVESDFANMLSASSTIFAVSNTVEEDVFIFGFMKSLLSCSLLSDSVIELNLSVYHRIIIWSKSSLKRHHEDNQLSPRFISVTIYGGKAKVPDLYDDDEGSYLSGDVLQATVFVHLFSFPYFFRYPLISKYMEGLLVISNIALIHWSASLHPSGLLS